MMWPRFSDCQECVSEGDYVCSMEASPAEYSQEYIDMLLKEAHDAREEDPEPKPEP